MIEAGLLALICGLLCILTGVVIGYNIGITSASQDYPDMDKQYAKLVNFIHDSN